jgi:hypothetical protein
MIANAKTPTIGRAHPHEVLAQRPACEVTPAPGFLLFDDMRRFSLPGSTSALIGAFSGAA